MVAGRYGKSFATGSKYPLKQFFYTESVEKIDGFTIQNESILNVRFLFQSA
jgi:hypothetical protein